MMRRIALILWLVVASAAASGGVWAAAHAVAKPCVAVPIDAARLASLPPVEEHPLAAGRIVAVDRDAGRLVVEHRPIERFYLEGTRRVFHVADRTMLTGLSPGDKIRFDVQRHGKDYVINRIENSN
jgi:Cu(I)/Ag(I) efflux system protein CusF